MKELFPTLLLIPLLLLAALPAARTQTLTIEADQPVAKVSPRHYGLMTEETNYSYDGGLYAELVRNRAFLSTGGVGEVAPMPEETVKGRSGCLPSTGL